MKLEMLLGSSGITVMLFDAGTVYLFQAEKLFLLIEWWQGIAGARKSLVMTILPDLHISCVICCKRWLMLQFVLCKTEILEKLRKEDFYVQTVTLYCLYHLQQSLIQLVWNFPPSVLFVAGSKLTFGWSWFGVTYLNSIFQLTSNFWWSYGTYPSIIGLFFFLTMWRLMQCSYDDEYADSPITYNNNGFLLNCWTTTFKFLPCII